MNKPIEEANKKYEKDIKENYPLYSWNKLFALAYPLTLGLCIAVFLFLWKNLKRMRFTPVFSLLIITGVGGYIWTVDIQTYDIFPAWVYFWWNPSGPEAWPGLALIDFIFFPVTTLMTCAIFYYFKEKQKNISDFKSKTPLILFTSLIVVSTFAIFYLTSYFGYMNSIFFSFPVIGMLLFFAIPRKEFHTKAFLLFVLLLGMFGFLMNFFMVDFIPLIGKIFNINLNSFAAWSYIIETNTETICSTVFVSKEQNPYLWILNSPIDMVVDMPIKGACFTYLLLDLIDSSLER